jgi:WD40 repeat protein
VYWLQLPDAPVRAWDVAAPEALVFSPDGKALVIEGIGTLDLRSFPDGQVIRAFPVSAVRSLAFSRDGQLLAAGMAGGDIAILRVSDASVLHTIAHAHDQSADTVAFSPAGDVLASGGRRDPRLRLWDVATGQERPTPLTREDGIPGLAFSPDGTRLAVASGSGLVVLQMPDAREVYRVAGTSWAVAYSAHAQWIVVAQGSAVKIVNASDGRVVWELANAVTEPEVLLAPNGRDLGLDDVKSLAISPDGQYVALAETRYITGIGSFSTDMFVTPWARIDLWRLADGRRVQRFAGHPRVVMALAFHPEGHTIVSLSRDHAAKFWRVRRGSLFLP